MESMSQLLLGKSAKVTLSGDYVTITSFGRDIYDGSMRSRRPREVVSVEGSDYVTTIPKRYGRIKRVERTEKNVKVLRRRFMDLCRTRLTKHSQPPLFCTFTFKESVQDVGKAYDFFTDGMARLRRRFGQEFVYIAVPEYHPGGHGIHFHALVWGLPFELGDVRHHGQLVKTGTERDTRVVASLWTYGWVDVLQTDGSEKLATYMCGYLFKSVYDDRLSATKAFTRSRNFGEPVVIRTSSAGTMLEYILDDGTGYEIVWSSLSQNRFFGIINYTIIKLDYENTA